MKKSTPKHKNQERKKNRNLIYEEMNSNITSKRNFEEIKTENFEEKELSSKKLKISNNNNNIVVNEKAKETENLNSFSIFQFIPSSIWEIIFNFLNDKSEKYELFGNTKRFYIKIPMNVEIFYSIRLCCKLFRNIISKYWIQYIPGNHLATYIKNCKKFQFSPQNIFIIKP